MTGGRPVAGWVVGGRRERARAPGAGAGSSSPAQRLRAVDRGELPARGLPPRAGRERSPPRARFARPPSGASREMPRRGLRWARKGRGSGRRGRAGLFRSIAYEVQSQTLTQCVLHPRSAWQFEGIHMFEISVHRWIAGWPCRAAAGWPFLCQRGACADVPATAP